MPNWVPENTNNVQMQPELEANQDVSRLSGGKAAPDKGGGSNLGLEIAVLNISKRKKIHRGLQYNAKIVIDRSRDSRSPSVAATPSRILAYIS